MNIDEFSQNNTEVCILQSTIPQIVKDVPCLLGIDEAGRGPVLGPMVYGICFAPLSVQEKIKEIGVADSKTLTAEQREQLFKKLDNQSEWLGWMVEILPPSYISNSMLRRSKYNLNSLSHDSAVRLVKRALDQGINVTEVYVDTVGIAEKYQSKLEAIFPQLKIVVAKKADSLYPIVSAASICAKVARDKAVTEWIFPEKLSGEVNYGTGYPSEPVTREYLKNTDPVFGYPQFVRFSWATAAKIIQDNCVSVYWEDDDEEQEKKPPTGTPTLSAFFRCKKERAIPTPHRYFRERHLRPVNHL